MSATLTMRMSDGQKTLISDFASAQGKTMSEFVLGAALDIIEDALDVRDWNEAYKEYRANPVTYSLDDVMEEFGLSSCGR